MRNLVKHTARLSVAKSGQLLMVSLLVFGISGCGDVDSGDGDVFNEFPLPMDSALTLYCPDAGIATDPCILDDPQNPYSITPVLALEPLDPEEVPDEDDERPKIKWKLAEDAPSAKARFYLWATVLAMEPTGEHQYYTAQALHEMYGESGSELARKQALKAYRSVLDNYFHSVTFFAVSDFIPGSTEVFSFPVRKLVGDNMVNGFDDVHLFDDEGPVLAVGKALGELGKWKYSRDGATGEVTSNN